MRRGTQVSCGKGWAPQGVRLQWLWVAKIARLRVEHSCSGSLAFFAVVLWQRLDASGMNTAALVRLHSLQLSYGKGWTPQG